MRGACLALALLLASPAQGAIRAVFVGINAYAHPSPDLKQLQGAVNDVALLKATLDARFKLGLDAGPGCRSENAVSVTLTDACATRAAILGALVARIAASAAGDTLLFFYSGHGAIAADATQEQAAGVHGTLVPHDARGGGIADIFDSELKLLIDDAAARGVNVVTIFDSCNSGTATRDLRPFNARRAGRATQPRPATLLRPPPPAAGSSVEAYRVHLGAARDNEIARETPDATGMWNGGFTRALVAAIAGAATPSYGDIIAEVRRAIPGTTQNPQAEGALTTPFLGVRTPPLRLFDAERDGEGVAIGGGALAGVTRGSTYGLFASDAAALAPGAVPLATGRVTAVEASRATLALGSLPRGSAWRALELVHAYGNDTLRLRIDGDAGLAAVLDGLDLITVTDKDPRLVLVATPTTARLHEIDGTPVGSELARADPAFAGRLRETLRKVANADALLALRNDRGAKLGLLNVRRACADDGECPALTVEGGETLIPAGTPVIVEIENISDRALYPYAFYVDGDRGILTLMPPPGARDPAMQPGDVRAVPRLRTAGAGSDTIVLVMADAPVDLASLEQAAVRDTGVPPRTDLDRLLHAARRGQSTREIPRVGTWGALALAVRRVAKEAK